MILEPQSISACGRWAMAPLCLLVEREDAPRSKSASCAERTSFGGNRLYAQGSAQMLAETSARDINPPACSSRPLTT